MGHRTKCPTSRTLNVRPIDAARETVGVIQACVAISVVALLLAGQRREGEAAAGVELSYQVLFRDQPPDVQRVYRELLSGIEEALLLRESEGRWPSVGELASEFVAPFAAVPGVTPDRTWRMARQGDFINYAGEPVPGTDAAAYLVLIQDNVPHPGDAVLDEFHRPLGEGRLVHVSIWMHDEPGPLPDLIVVPEREGWTQIVNGPVPVE